MLWHPLSVSLDKVENKFQLHWAFFRRSCAMFTGLANTEFSKKKKKNFKIGSHTVLFIFKIILLQYFQFLVISDIQTYPK